MRGQEQQALTVSQRAFVVFEAFIDDDLADVFAGVATIQADLSQLAAEGSEYSTKNVGAFFAALLRKREFQIAFANAAQLSVQEVNDPGERDPGRARQRPRQRTDTFQKDPCQRVFESVTQGNGRRYTGENSLSIHRTTKAAAYLRGS